MTERGDPEALVAQLNEYFSRMVEVVFANHGTIDKFVGDMVMALFGAPLDDPDHADHAVADRRPDGAALEELNARWAPEGRPALGIGIGVNSGEMIAGNIGSASIRSYTVIGDAVNLGRPARVAEQGVRHHHHHQRRDAAQLKAAAAAAARQRGRQGQERGGRYLRSPGRVPSVGRAGRTGHVRDRADTTSGVSDGVCRDEGCDDAIPDGAGRLRRRGRARRRRNSTRSARAYRWPRRPTTPSTRRPRSSSSAPRSAPTSARSSASSRTRRCTAT